MGRFGHGGEAGAAGMLLFGACLCVYGCRLYTRVCLILLLFHPLPMPPPARSLNTAP